jgi:hypothetical protein
LSRGVSFARAGSISVAAVLLSAISCAPSTALLEPPDQLVLCVTTEFPSSDCASARQVTVIATAPDPADPLPSDAGVVLTVSSGWLMDGTTDVGSVALTFDRLGEASAIWCPAADGGSVDGGAAGASSGGTTWVSANSGTVSSSACVGPGCDAGC